VTQRRKTAGGQSIKGRKALVEKSKERHAERNAHQVGEPKRKKEKKKPRKRKPHFFKPGHGRHAHQR
jgi:hypothetical protein